MIGEDTLLLPVEELSKKIRARQLSPRELTEGYLARIRKYSASLNAYQTVTAGLALAQARSAESEIDAGRHRGPLHGIPYGAKDLLATAGIETSWGARPLKGQMFNRDATVVRKLREAGAVLLGKCAMVEFAGCLGYRYPNASISGPGRNPWNPKRWTGGSSSGSGAAVAAGLAGFALGTETWGSILCPSAFCGITGLRPTYGRVSRAGGMVGSWTFDKVGPLARSAGDCRLVLKEIAGPDPDDPSAAREQADLTPRAGKRIPELRGAIVRPDYAKYGEPESKQAFENAVSALRLLGLKLEEAKLPELPIAEAAGVIITAEALSTFENFYRDGRVRQLVDDIAPYQVEINAPLTAADLVKAWRVRTVAQQKMAELFSRYDVIVSPNFLSVAPPIEQDLNKSLAYPDPMGPFGNACGLPAIALPCGFGREHMPLSFQIMGAPFEEATLLDLGESYQSRTGFHREHPKLGG